MRDKIAVTLIIGGITLLGSVAVTWILEFLTSDFPITFKITGLGLLIFFVGCATLTSEPEGDNDDLLD